MRFILSTATALSVALAPTAAAAQRAGQLIAAAPVVETPGGMQAWRIRYWTTDGSGRPRDVTGMVVAPREAIPRQPRPVIAWTHGTSGVASNCAPSMMPGFWTATPALAAVARGSVVVAPDYPGLGSNGVHPYLVGVPTARSTLDAVRAARQIPGSAAGDRFAVWGESQGGHAALWTGQEARRYAPDLQLVGVAAAAPPTDLIANLRSGKDPSIRAFLTAFTAYSWSRYYGAPLSSLGNRQTQRIITRLAQNNCITLDSKPKLGTMLGVLVLRRDLKNVDLGTIQPWARHSRANSISAAAISAPLLIAQNPADVIVDPATTRRFARQACTLNKRVRWIDIRGKGHETSARDSASVTLEWIANRFAGKPAPKRLRPHLMGDVFEHLATRAAAAGRPWAFALALGIVIGWGFSGPLFGWSDTWQLVINTGTTIVTFLMVFLIQNAQNRDAAAIQAKLDEVIRAIDGARNEFIGIEHLTEAELERIRSDIEKDYGDESKRHAAIERLIGRR